MTLPVHEMLDALLAQLEADDAAVADGAPGPAPLAAIYQGELDRDLTDPVIRQIRFDQFLREVVRLGADIATRMGSAAIEYSVGGDADSDLEDEHDRNQSNTSTNPRDVEE